MEMKEKQSCLFNRDNKEKTQIIDEKVKKKLFVERQ